MRRALELMQRLGDGAEHSGADLAAELGVSRAAIWNHVQRLREEGVDIEATPGHGYRLGAAYELLDGARIRDDLAAAGARGITKVGCELLVDSTNERLLEAQGTRDIHGEVMFAEYQTAGRGRRGDRWLSPPGAGLCFSLGWRFDAPPATFSALSLVVGVALAETLRASGLGDVRLKWPNDLQHDGHKLAGILIEMRAEAGGPSVAVIGIGLNVSLSAAAHARIDQPSGDIATLSGRPVSRNALAVSVLAALDDALATFEREGFAPFRARWTAADALADAPVSLDLGSRSVSGIARGVDDHGALLLDVDGRREAFVSGHVARR